jgi:hypothetical protein
MTESKIATEPKVAPKADTKATYETREAIMACGCRIIMDAATYDAEGAHCAVHDNTEVVRVIKVPPVELVDEGTPLVREGEDDNGAKKRAALIASRRK